MNHSNTHGIIVGGGVIGLSLAWELARRGHRITLVDRSETGRATSWAGAGILPPANLDSATDPIDQLRGLSHRLFPRWHQELLQSTGIDSGYRRCGGIYLADTPGERASMMAMTHFWHDMQIECEPLTPAQLVEREPALSHRAQRPPVPSAWWVPDECQIRSPRYLQALKKANQTIGVEIIESISIDEVHATESGAHVRCRDRVLHGDFAVICGGAWSGHLARQFGLEASLVPVRGQILLFQCDRPPLTSVVNVGHRYLVPREDGYVLVGSNEEEVGFMEGTTPSTLESLERFAIDLCSPLETATRVKSWSGLRPMTFDGFPMIGRVPETKHVYVASGHFRSGLHLSCATAEVVANLIEERDNVLDLDPFRVGKQQHSPSLH